MDTIISIDHRALITSTFRKLMPDSDTFVHLFYTRLFELKPSIKPLFKHSIDDQGPKLIGVLAIVVKSSDHLDDLMPAIQDLSKRHVAYGVKREDYALVGEALLWSLEQMLRQDFTLDVKEAWADMYGSLAQICIEAAYK